MSALVLKIKSRGSQKKQLIVNVGRVVSKKAVQRNLIKRRINAIMRPLVKNKKNDFLIIVGPTAANLSYKETKKEIEGYFYQT